MRPKENFNVGLRNGLLDRKHYQAMRGDALWLYSFLVDRQTRRLDKNGLGKVAGGAPISDGDVAGSFGCSEKTVSRWRRKLARGGYIAVRRTSFGYVYAITKPKKWGEDDRTETADHCSDTNDPMIGQKRVADRTDVSETKKRCQEMSVVAATAVPEKQVVDEVNAAWDYYRNVFQNGEEIISPSARRMGIAILAGLREKYPTISSEQCADAMTAAIDAARHIAKAQPKKQYFSRWFGIFGNFETFHSLWEEE
jgi:hypothetical protein